MGLQHELGLRVGTVNPAQRVLQRIASLPAASWLFQRTLYLVDRPLFRWTKGRVSLPGVLAGIPVAILTTTGARTGQQRAMPLGVVPLGGDLAVLGTNYGQRHTPGWVFNLEANPRATLAWRGRTAEVLARPATDSESAAVWERARGIYAGYGKYQRRITGRTVRIFVLESVGL